MSPPQLFSAQFEHLRGSSTAAPVAPFPPRSLLPGKAQMGERHFSHDAVHRELDKLQRSPPTSKATAVASRSLVRFARSSQDSDEDHAIRATEEWVRLYVALRRVGGPEVERLSADTLRTWYTRVTRHFL